MSFAVRQAWPTDLDALANVAVQAQRDPQRFVAYLGDDAASIAADLTEIDGVESWTQATHVALDDHRNVIGWLAVDTDADLGRTWWWGPFLADGNDDLYDPIADALARAGGQRVADIAEHELAFDERSTLLAGFALRHGFVAEDGSVVLNTTDMVLNDEPVRSAVEPIASRHHDAVVELHDEIFPGTHTPGSLLVDQTDGRHRRFVVEAGDTMAGYVATVLQNDDSLYIDYLGVAQEHRGQGVGRALITAAMQAHQDDATHAHLTVVASNVSARRLYESLGFAEERVLVPYRRGFELT